MRRDSREKGYYFSPRRVGAMVLRYFYLLRGSLPRIIELAYWPTMQMLIWGFMSRFYTNIPNGRPRRRFLIARSCCGM